MCCQCTHQHHGWVDWGRRWSRNLHQISAKGNWMLPNSIPSCKAAKIMSVCVLVRREDRRRRPGHIFGKRWIVTSHYQVGLSDGCLNTIHRRLSLPSHCWYAKMNVITADKRPILKEMECGIKTYETGLWGLIPASNSMKVEAAVQNEEGWSWEKTLSS